MELEAKDAPLCEVFKQTFLGLQRAAIATIGNRRNRENALISLARTHLAVSEARRSSRRPSISSNGHHLPLITQEHTGLHPLCPTRFLRLDLIDTDVAICKSNRRTQCVFLREFNYENR
jgi:hypothetical protein